jgi:hypothetical protein
MPRLRGLLIAFALAGPAAALEAQQRSISVGQARTDSLTAQDPVRRSRRAPYHVWLLEGRRGQKLVMDLMSPDFDAYLSLRDAEGYSIGSDDDSGDDNDARLRVILPRDGTYRIIATAYSEDARGVYTLLIRGWETPAAAPAGASVTIRTGDTVDGLLEPGDEVSGDGPFEDRLTFEARAGARLRVEMRSSEFDAYLYVLGPDGRVLGSDDDGLGDNNAVVSLRAPTTGRYTILATSYGDDPKVGSYRVSLVEETGSFAEPGAAAPIAPGETRDGRLETGDASGPRGLEDRWTFTGRAGQVVRIDVMSQAFDAYSVLRFGETAVDSNDDGGDGNNSRILTVLPNSGAYTLVVSAYSENRSGGRYQVSLTSATLSDVAGQTGRISFGQRLAGRLEQADRARDVGEGREDWWEFDGRSGQEVEIEARSGAFDTFIELRSASGSVIAENDDGLGQGTDSYIAHRLPATGRYRIVVRGYGEGDARGIYELWLGLTRPAAAAGGVQELSAGETFTGRLEAGDSVLGDSTLADFWLFRPTRSGEVVVDLRSGDFDAYLIIQDASGSVLASDDDGGSGTDSRVTVRVRAGATYRILASSYGSERATGSYRLSLRWSP